MTSGPGVAMELMGDEAVSVWRRILNPTDSGVARKEAPPSLRAQFGTDGTRNAGHGSDSLASAERELEFFFPSTAGHGPANTANYTDCACCVIKPHVVSEGPWRSEGLTHLRPSGTSVDRLIRSNISSRFWMDEVFFYTTNTNMHIPFL
ncbi:nucleoside diphosphate kinase 7-like isoform X1 [Coregonus clupeaformis]|uniref:nucleoside diphosphate kinase 7-like isoform X1 n=1 Tax=Coregonus clupeaformis TaxID=59861 RepID=UPI001E1C4B59|nr:nucleoside diphosphate kinase 7-like isoform X1 [Coregonus clupeaformis]